MNWTLDERTRRSRLLLEVTGKMPEPIRLVEQTSPHGCGFACLAMVLRRDLDYVKRRVGRDPEQVCEEFDLSGALWAEEICRVLWEHGVAHLRYAVARPPGPHPDCGFDHGPWRFHLRDNFHFPSLGLVNRHVEDGGTAILGLPPNDEREGHWVVMAGREVLDPLPGQLPISPGRLELEEAVLIRE
jgi:hypothetical protein